MSQVISDYAQITRLASYGTLPVSGTTLMLTPGASSTPSSNGQVSLDLPVNTRLRFHAKGSDGQVRWFTPARYNFATNSLAVGDVGDVFHDGTQAQACWNTTIIGQGAAGGVGTPGTHFITDTCVYGATAGKSFRHGNGNSLFGNLSMEIQADIAHMTCFGDSTFRKATAVSDSVAVGYVAGQETLTGAFDVFIGSFAGCYADATDHNILIGGYAGARAQGSNAPLGSHMLGMGYEAMRYASGSHSIGLGNQAFFSTTGDRNVGVGYRVGDGITTGSNNTFFGALAGNNSDGIQKADAIESIGIGYNVRTTKSYQAILGSANITETILRGDVTGIGSIDLSQDKLGTTPTNGALWRGSGILYLTMATSGLYVQNSAATKTLIHGTDAGNTFFGLQSSAVPAFNGFMGFEATSNTTVTMRFKGSDGTVRSVAFTLS